VKKERKEDMKIFITGGTGFIGSQLVQCLAGDGHQLVCLARKTSDIRPLQEAGVTIVYGDITDKKSLQQGMQGCDWMVHLADSYTFWQADRSVFHSANIQGMRNIMEAALEAQIKKVVLVSTVVTYGDAQWPITESSQPGDGCASEYAQTKRAGDEIAWQLYRDKNLPLVVIYPSCVVGPHDPNSSGRYIQNLIHGRMPAQILTGRPFSFVYVKDVCNAIWQALEKENNIGEKYIVNGTNMTWGELNKLICEVSNASVPKLRLPTPMVILNASMLTALSSLTKKAPWLDLSIDQVNIMNQGCIADGSKAERELGMHYTPLRQALADAVANP
jgi:dihydroflavonol-4-reductase